jgi:serine/threonine-protein kinase
MTGSGSSADDGLVRRVLRDLSEHERTRTEPGTPSFSRFEILGTLGQGATAVVYRARDRVLGREVAVKVLRDLAGLTETARERFRREAKAAAGLAHPNVVAVHDAGEENGRPYLVMELVEGRPLGDLLKDGGRAALLGILEKAARGVAAAHARGVVHRDLKPANILVTAAGEPKVGDFGLAHVLETRSELTRTGTALGTPLYMAPEQVEGRPEQITPRTDVYALGAILYEALAGRPPHSGETLAELYRKIVRDDPPAPAAGEAGVIALKAVEKDPARRYEDAEAFADDLRRHLAGEPVLARPVGPTGRFLRRVKRNPAGHALVAVALAGLLAAVGLAVQVARLTPDPRPWTPVFDGTSAACFMGGMPDGWRLEGGELVSARERPGAVQTDRLFRDGEVRVRFVAEKMSYLGFNIRLGTTGGWGVSWDRGGVERMGGAERTLLFTCRGEDVAATLDGAPLPVELRGRNAEGTLHFGGVGGRLRIRGIDYRGPR